MVKPKKQSKPALPVTLAATGGPEAHLLIDANGEVLGALFGVKSAQYVVKSVNSHDLTTQALKRIAATATGKQIPKIALDALKQIGEI